ncbi:MAG TPA: flagellar basal body-associated FliL family protein [Anaerolineaceae bacterium]|nr:flagellar basal body-associated FliL family protein [Anaerolineaceae bacterium]HPN52807.1 flagellar basal body-associated FliL family protein [Anaerolineaceae bacterium]
MTTPTPEKPPRKINIAAILTTVVKVMVALVLFATAVSNMLMVYIVFGPDDWPKPFYLMYLYPSGLGGVQINIPASSVTTSGEGTSQSGHTSESESKSKPGEGITIDTGTKIINLADPGGRKFIRLNVVLEFESTNPTWKTLGEEPKAEFLAEFNAEVDAILPAVNDTIITLVSTKDFASIYTSEGKEALRAELLAELNKKISEPKVLAVYFTEFVVQ